MVNVHVDLNPIRPTHDNIDVTNTLHTSDVYQLLARKTATLCKSTRKFHGRAREKNLKTLQRDLYDINYSDIDFRTKDGYELYTNRKFIENLKNCKDICKLSIYNKISAIQSKLNILVFTRADFEKTFKSLRKLFNPLQKDNIYYTNTGAETNLDIDVLHHLRQNAQELCNRNKSDDPTIRDMNTYSTSEINRINLYFSEHIKNFLSSSQSYDHNVHNEQSGKLTGNSNYIFDELSLIVLILLSSGRRIGEIISLSNADMEKLINNQQLTIRAKSGLKSNTIYISTNLANILNQYIEKTNRAFPLPLDAKFFHLSYMQCWKTMRKILIQNQLISPDKDKFRTFHSFRYYYANKFHNTDNKNQRIYVSDIMGHRSQRMTRQYAEKHTLDLQESNNLSAYKIKRLNRQQYNRNIHNLIEQMDS